MNFIRLQAKNFLYNCYVWFDSSSVFTITHIFVQLYKLTRYCYTHRKICSLNVCVCVCCASLILIPAVVTCMLQQSSCPEMVSEVRHCVCGLPPNQSSPGQTDPSILTTRCCDIVSMLWHWVWDRGSAMRTPMQHFVPRGPQLIGLHYHPCTM